MRVVVDGKPLDSLPDRIAGQIRLAADRPVAAGAVMSLDACIAAMTSKARLEVGLAYGGAALIALIMLVGALVSRSRELVFVAPIDIAVVGGLAVGWFLVTQRRAARAREEAPRRLARLPPTGAEFHLDAGGLRLADRLTPWSRISLRGIEITVRKGGDGPDDYVVDLIELDLGGRTVVLDSQAIENGRAVVAKALRCLDVAWARRGKASAKVAP